MPPHPRKELVTVGPPPAVPYTTAVSAGGLIYLSGTLAEDGSGAIGGLGDVGAQTARTLARMGEVLAAAGSSLEHVVSVTVYLTSAAHFQTMNAAYRPFWPKDPPTRTTVITGLVVPDALVEITMIAVAKDRNREVVHPAGWMKSPNPYSYGIRSGDTFFLSGLVPRSGRDNSPVPGDIAAQTHVIMQNAGELLQAAGMTFDNIVSSRVYLTDASNFPGMNDAYRSYFSAAPPARATVTSGLAGPDFLVEMTFTASAARREAVGSPPPGIPISPAIKAGERVYVSGALGNTPETAGDVAAQTRETLARIKRTLELAGATPADVVESMVYLKDARSFGPMNQAYREFFGREFPARTTVVSPLVVDDGLVEIMVTAILP
jgi:2-iminobutanoate/2-iminopropanoate deaminase